MGYLRQLQFPLIFYWGGVSLGVRERREYVDLHMCLLAFFDFMLLQLASWDNLQREQVQFEN